MKEKFPLFTTISSIGVFYFIILGVYSCVDISLYMLLIPYVLLIVVYISSNYLHKRLVAVTLSILLISGFLLLWGSPNNQNNLVAQEMVLSEPSNDSDYHQTINEFRRVVENNDAEHLYELVDLNYEGEVYWTKKEAQDLIDYFKESPMLFNRQIDLLEESVPYIESLDELNVDVYPNKEKRIPYAALFDGFVFLQPDGQLSVNVMKHTIKSNIVSDEDFDKLILTYKDTDREFVFRPSTLKENTYKNHNNEEVIEVMYVGPGNYTIDAELTIGDTVKKAEALIDLTDEYMTTKLDRKNEQIMRMSFK